ncbi:MAG: hypothetical protein OEM01_00815 [Desulfobulbaceae bacterium]|nr:hypothetical protein [Desulfobulbaceae bacterium]
MNKTKKKHSHPKRLFVLAALCLSLVAGMQVQKAIADDAVSAEDEASAPSFTNPAQAQHAANLASAAASQPDEALETLQSAVEKAEKDLNALGEEAAEEDITAAEEKLAEAQEAYAAEISERTGVVTDEIEAMRNSGMGWGQIAQELGLHPGLLGLGHTKREKNAFGNPHTEEQNEIDAETDELTEATERNTRSGWSKGHGVGLNAGVVSTSKTKGGFAYGHTKKGSTSATSTQGGISGASGLSGDENRGKGNGNGSAANDGSPGNSGNNKGGGSDSKGNKGGNGKGGKNK